MSNVDILNLIRTINGNITNYIIGSCKLSASTKLGFNSKCDDNNDFKNEIILCLNDLDNNHLNIIEISEIDFKVSVSYIKLSTIEYVTYSIHKNKIILEIFRYEGNDYIITLNDNISFFTFFKKLQKIIYV